jgi:predicted SAM-dependent methyltransferase
VREKIPDAAVGDLPEPIVVDQHGHARRVESDEGVRLNLGCGEKPLLDYINVDMRELPGVDVVADVRRLPYGPGTVAEISSAHLVEHFRQHHLKAVVLPYWRSLLAEDGRLRIVCPNWAVLIEQFNAGQITVDQLKQVTFGLQDYAGDDHFAMYTPDTLKQLLLETGFDNVEILEDRRQNGLSPEMELVAKPATPATGVAATERLAETADSRS